jgi:hypothetical protein
MDRHRVLRVLVPLLLAALLPAACASGCGSTATGSPGHGATSDEGPWRLVAEIDDVQQIAFADRDHGWLIRTHHSDAAVSEGPGVWTSDDGGRTWTACDGRIESTTSWDAPAPTVAKLVKPAFVTPLGRRTVVVAFQGSSKYEVVGGAGTYPPANKTPGGVLMTRDAGRRWTTCLRLPLREVIAANCWTDARHGWVLSFQGSFGPESRIASLWTLRRTADGGRSWRELGQWEDPRDRNRLVTCPVGRMTMVDRRVGWELFLTPWDEAAESWSVMCRTPDGGQTWEPVKHLPVAGDEDGSTVRYATNPDGFQARGRDDVWCWMAIEPMMEGDTMWEGALWHTVDGGRSWEYASIADPVDGAYFADDRRGWLATDISRAGEAVLVTEDGGRTWQPELSVEGRFWSFVPAGDQIRLVVAPKVKYGEPGPYRLYERAIDR